jgi:diaminohydroxyphosphoribosylaminopyrimidine deaminase/5-amino-6-(5-phosphoribosylamino)uracil reductase
VSQDKLTAERAADEEFMRRALELAARGLGRTSPNPAVGSVVVAEGQIVGEGFHPRAGQPHAEPLALQDAGERARGATIYVTLEPCCHWGRTPPCTDAIIRAGVRRVVYACDDCDERCAGMGAQKLREAGLEVTSDVLATEARRLNEAYIHHKLTGRPFVTLKMACTLDGKIATSSGDSRWVTGEAARRQVHELRDRSDVVMVGVGTVLADDPQLTTRLEEPSARDALRVVVDSQARTPVSARVLHAESQAGCLIAVTSQAAPERIEALRKAGAEVLVLEPGPAAAGEPARVPLGALMDHLGAQGQMSVLLEGGGTLAAAALAENLVHKLVLFYAPKVLGGDGIPVFAGPGPERMAGARALSITAVERVGDDLRVDAYPCSQG